MAEQTYQNHTRSDVKFHYFLCPVLIVNLGVAVARAVHRANAWHLWNIAVALALLLLATMVRTYALRVQDRVIRLEERIRMAALLPMDAQMLQRELKTGQIIALRFASDAELADLTERTVREDLAPKVIKQQIKVWRPDTHRV